jgi:transposase-like protein
MKCKYYKGECQKADRQKNGVQKYYCQHCKKYQQKKYQYRVYNKGVAEMIPRLLCNSVGIRGIARVLQIAVNTAAKLIESTAKKIHKPPIPSIVNHLR